MHRTQIYLTGQQRRKLSAVAKATGKKQSELIRQAVDLLIERSQPRRRNEILNKAAGMWKDRRDLPDFVSVRNQWDRH